MNERPTPRTASAMMEIPSKFDSVWVVPAEVACDLESELSDALRERDEAREEIKELIYIAERAIALAEIDFENDKFGIVSELRENLEKIKEAAK